MTTYYESILDTSSYSYAKVGKLVYHRTEDDMRVYNLITKTTCKISSMSDITDVKPEGRNTEPLAFEIKENEGLIEISWDIYRCGKIFVGEIQPDYALYGIKHVYPEMFELLQNSVDYDLGIDLSKVQHHEVSFWTDDEETDSDE